MSLRFRICLIVWLMVVVITALTGRVQAQELISQPVVSQRVTNGPTPIQLQGEVTEEIILEPAPSGQVIRQRSPIADADWTIEIVPRAKRPVEVSANAEAEKARLYKEIYASIPFNRAEYNTNPSYRHDATMEILTGNARHKTLLIHNKAAGTVAPAAAPQTVIPYGFVRPAVRLNYYRHFPSLNPYTNMFWHLGY